MHHMLYHSTYYPEIQMKYLSTFWGQNDSSMSVNHWTLTKMACSNRKIKQTRFDAITVVNWVSKTLEGQQRPFDWKLGVKNRCYH